MFIQKHKSERGQAIVLIALAIVGLVGFTALAVDGGFAYSDRRQAQNAADSAALSAALSKIRGGTQTQFTQVAENIATSNGYDNNGTTNTITLNNPPLSGAYADCSSSAYDCNEYIQVIIESEVETFFAPVIGVEQTTNTVEAVARAKSPTIEIPFDGNAVVGLDPNGYSFDAWGTSTWYIYGGGVFANNDARGKNNKDNVIFPDGDCATAVGTASYFSCTVSNGNADKFYNYPDDITSMLPPIPPCDGTAYSSGGLMHEEAGYEGRGSVVSHIDNQYAPGIYCIQDANGNIHDTISGTGVTLYIMDTNFTMKFNGGGGMAVQAPTSGAYKGIMMFSALTSSPCTQNIEFRGNGSGDNVGTIFMPSACIDARGNSGASQDRSQVIGYQVTSNGNGDVVVNYNPDDNAKLPVPPEIQLAE